jgi:hypothetical protein
MREQGAGGVAGGGAGAGEGLTFDRDVGGDEGAEF